MKRERSREREQRKNNNKKMKDKQKQVTKNEDIMQVQSSPFRRARTANIVVVRPATRRIMTTMTTMTTMMMIMIMAFSFLTLSSVHGQEVEFTTISRNIPQDVTRIELPINCIGGETAVTYTCHDNDPTIGDDEK